MCQICLGKLSCLCFDLTRDMSVECGARYIGYPVHILIIISISLIIRAAGLILMYDFFALKTERVVQSFP